MVRETLQSQRLTFLVAALLLGLMGAFAVLSMKDDSPTVDEIVHIPAGYTYLTTQEYRFNPFHPPLVKDFAAFPLLLLDLNFPRDDPSWVDNVNDQWDFGSKFFYKFENDPDQILFWARMPMVILMLLLGIFLFWWAWKLGGKFVGLGVLFLFTFSPTFLAHGRLVTTDVVATLGIVLAIYAYLKFLEVSTFRRALLAATSLAFALLVKFSTLVLLPYLAFLTLLYLITQSQKTWRVLLYGLFVGLLAFLLVGIVYELHILNYSVERQIQDAKVNLSIYYNTTPEEITFPYPEWPLFRGLSQYLLGLFMVIARASQVGVQYFLGEIGLSHNWWHYFPILYLFKIPLAFHFLGVLAVVSYLLSVWKSPALPKEEARIFLRRHFITISLSIFVILYLLVATVSPLKIGIRHILPIFPFLYILTALGIKRWVVGVRFPSLRIKVILLITLGIWYMVSSILTFPHYLSYYNELAGGTKSGYKIAVNSNYDWGQDLKRLGLWAESNGIEKLYVDYFGRPTLNPQYYLGSRYTAWKGSSWWRLYGGETELEKAEDFPRGNYLAVSVKVLLGGEYNASGDFFERDYDWLDEYTPVERIGTSIFVYYIE